AGGPTEGLQTVAEAPAWYHPGRSGTLKLGNKPLCHFGELHPGVLAGLDVKGPMAAFELFLESIPLPKPRPSKARPALAAQPLLPLERDFAFVVDQGVAAEAVLRAAKGADKTLIAGVSVFDLYEGGHVGEGRKSIAIAVTLQPTDHTPTDAEIEAVSAKIVQAVVKATGGALRG
ncbi:MAG: phenylalanine--tRNA ligase subunit beta, partial [Alphaproteobacteria bacterium]|nr:phenylalanine--tRNA ligase subunit beta [Alphaproteobacteria bacterium]